MMNSKNYEACREIVQNLISKEGNVEKLKLLICCKYRLSDVPSNADILATATEIEKEKILNILRLKPVRSISGINVVCVMSKPWPCPHGKCAYCPSIKGIPNSYTGREPSTMRGIQNDFDSYRQVASRLNQLRRIGHSAGKVELIVQGGTFPATSFEYQKQFIKGCLDALTGEKSRDLSEAKQIAENCEVKNVGITFETRPDFAKQKHIDKMLKMGVTKVELGVQNIYDDIYQLVERGHEIKDVIKATKNIKDAGLKICYHMMPGLPGSNLQRDLEGFKTIFNDQAFKPDMLKIYPCLVLKGSKLYDWWKEGKYKAYNTKETVKLIVEVKKLIPSWIRIMRIQRDIPAQLIVNGVKKSNLRQIVLDKIKHAGCRCNCIRCREVGHRLLKEKLEPDVSSIKLIIKKYEASDGLEYFISFEDITNAILIGYLRLRIPSCKDNQPEVSIGNTSLVRELHIYGPLVTVGKHIQGAWQHRGYGKALLKEAERISKVEEDVKKILVTSALGTRNYFKRMGYKLQEPYMVKLLY